MATAVHKAKRERPEDGGMVWHEELHAFECYGCNDFEEVHAAHSREPDELVELKEGFILLHTVCWQFDDPEMARDAMRHMKEKQRRALRARGAAGFAAAVRIGNYPFNCLRG